MIFTAHGLKFADQTTAYHVGTLPGVQPTRQNRPVELAPDPRRVADTVARHVERARLLVQICQPRARMRGGTA